MASEGDSNEAGLRISPGNEVSESRRGRGPAEHIARHRHTCCIAEVKTVPELECS